MRRPLLPLPRRGEPIALRLSRLRAYRGMTLMDVARCAAVSVGTVHRVESGARHRPRIDTLARIAGALRVGTAYFL